MHALQPAPCATPPTATQPSPFRAAFTLIEMLLVIAIIAILASMLLPTLHLARERAKLTVCLSRQRQVAVGGHLYASDNATVLPYRGATYATVAYGNPRPRALFQDHSGQNAFDDRPRLNPYIELDALQCPFLPRFDVAEHPPVNENIFTSYSIYFGWKLTDDNGDRMERLGDTMTLDTGEEFDIWVADFGDYRVGVSTGNGHPGTGQSLRQRDDADYVYAWYGASVTRGPIDMNFVRMDGSGFRVRNVAITDDRLARVPYEYGDTDVTPVYSQLPTVDYR